MTGNYIMLTKVEWEELKRILADYSRGVESEYNSDSGAGEWDMLIKIVEKSQQDRVF